MSIIHIGLSSIFFLIGFIMRYGLSSRLVIFFYHRIPKLSINEFNEYTVRRFIGETSIKLGVILLTIALVGLWKPEESILAIILGWLCFIIIAVGSVTFLDKINLFKKLKNINSSRSDGEQS